MVKHGQARGHPRRRDRPGGRRRGAQGARGGHRGRRRRVRADASSRSAHGRYLETGDVLTDDDLEAIKGHDAILLGAVGGVPGDPRLAGANIERGLLLKLRFELDHYVNLRPSVLYPGVASPLADPGDVDFVVVREGTEGPYVGNGGAIRVGTPAEVANEVSVNTALRRRARRALRVRRGIRSPRKKLTLVHKTNVLVFAGSLWKRTVDAVAAEYPEVDGRLPARRRRDHLPRHRSCSIRRHRHRQPLRRHPHRPGRRDQRRHRPRGLGQHQPRRPVPEHVRAGARLGARHRRAGHRRSRPPRSSRSRCCSTTSAGRTPRPQFATAVTADIAERGDTRTHRPPRSATRSPPASAHTDRLRARRKTP